MTLSIRWRVWAWVGFCSFEEAFVWGGISAGFIGDGIGFFFGCKGRLREIRYTIFDSYPADTRTN
jgi:hypothetical protein